MTVLAPPILAAVVIAYAALDWTPGAYLVATWPGRIERIPVTTAAICDTAIDAILAGRWLADDPPLSLRCEVAR